MSMVETTPGRAEESAIVTAARAGDESAFSALVERYRRELQVHCYRMLGSFEDSEDMVQETLLRAWRKRESFEGRSSFRAWLYRIATNACLDFLAHNERRVISHEATAADPGVALAPPHIPWLQPYPDRLLEQVAPRDAEPDAVVVAKETIELAFSRGSRLWFRRGDVLWLIGLPLRALHNRGREPAVLVAVSRRGEWKHDA
jgi:RNA polymerase sigma-70 factor (ECF subfamily)